MLNVALSWGSSIQGNTFRASTACSWLAKMYLVESNTELQYKVVDYRFIRYKCIRQDNAPWFVRGGSRIFIGAGVQHISATCKNSQKKGKMGGCGRGGVKPPPSLYPPQFVTCLSHLFPFWPRAHFSLEQSWNYFHWIRDFQNISLAGWRLF